MPCDPLQDQNQIVGSRMRAMLTFWLLITTNECFISTNPGKAALKSFDWTTIPGLTKQDRDLIAAYIENDPNGAFGAVRAAWGVFLYAGSPSYLQSQEASDLKYTDHNCPRGISEIIKAFVP